MRVSWDGWTVDVPARTITGADGPVHVEPQVFDVLAYLIANHERVVAKHELLDEIWGDQFVSESALTTRIKGARRAIGDDGRTQKYIRNVHGRGYQFIGEVGAPASTDASVASSSGAETPSSPAASVDSLAVSISVDDEFPFVGRDAELVVAADLVAGTDPSLLLIAGEPGVGKSRLAIEMLQRAAATGATVCVGACDETSRYALGPVRDALEQLLTTDPARAANWVAGIEGQLLSLVPALVGQLQGEPVPTDGYSATAVVAKVFERAARTGPVVLLIDDLQWSDEPTRNFVSRIVRRLRGLPLHIVCTHRASQLDLAGDARRWVDQHRRLPSASAIDLDVLTADQSHDLVDQVLGSDFEADSLVTRTQGNGLFLTESIRDVLAGSEAETSIDQAVRARIDRLDDDAGRFVRAGALLGTEFSFDLATAAADLAAESALAAIDSAIDAGLLHETETPLRFRFSHQLVPHGIRAAIGRSEAATMHLRCATALDRSGGDPVDIARHQLAAIPLVPIDEAVTQARAAATAAASANQFDRAKDLLDAVLAAGVQARTRAEVEIEVGQVVLMSGAAEGAVGHFEHVAEVARRNGWPDLFVQAALGHMGQSPYRRLSDTSTLDLLAEADGLLGDEPGVDKARVLAKTAVFSQFTMSLADRDKMTRRALDMVPDVEGDDRIKLLEARAIVFSCPAGVDELAVLDPQLDKLRAAANTYFADASSPETRIMMVGDGEGMRREARADESRIRAQPIAEWRDFSMKATMAAFDRDVDTARQFYDEAGEIGPRFWGESAYVLHALSRLFCSCCDGDWDSAPELIELLIQFNPDDLLLPSAAWAHLAAGNRARGLELVAMMRPEVRYRFGENIIGGNALIALAEVALLLEDADMAADAEAHLLPFADLMLGLPWAPALAASDSLSRLAAARGDDEAAARYALRAAALYADLTAGPLIDRIPAPG